MDRRTVLKTLLAAPLQAQPRSSSKKVIVAGAGIAGLCSAYELTKRNCEVVLLEAAGRTGGHIMTLRDGFADGLYADAGAEHFYRPGYDQFWSYIDEFKLPVIEYPRRREFLRWTKGRFYSKEELASPDLLKKFGYNAREIEYLHRNPGRTIAALYYMRYADRFADEMNPFGAGLDHLDAMTAREFLVKEGASPAAAAGGSQSALQAVWHAAIRVKRKMAWQEENLFRIRGGNQLLTDAFAARLGNRVRMGCPITGIEHWSNGVRVQFRDSGKPKTEEADYLVTCIPLTMLRQIPVKPGWSEAKQYVVQNLPYTSHCRVIFQSRTRFWQSDKVSPNMSLGGGGLNTVWAMAEEVRTPRGILLGTANATTPEKALESYRHRYPGKSEDIEQCRVVNWTTDPWAMPCLPAGLAPGQLAKFWPQIIRPQGRIHFAGVYADSYTFGMEAAVRSARRAASEIGAA